MHKISRVRLKALISTKKVLRHSHSSKSINFKKHRRAFSTSFSSKTVFRSHYLYLQFLSKSFTNFDLQRDKAQASCFSVRARKAFYSHINFIESR